jgi:histidinol-phosphate/aromatic aminotransferase/cobyric acid decarboxylase-like protein
VGADTRAVALSSPNDPTGAPVTRADVRALCERVGERVWVLLDEAFADFLEPGEDAAPLVAELPNLLVFRTFAKAHAMAGFRIGYVLAPTAELAERLTPSFSVNAPAQAAAAWALELGDPVLARRRAAATRERERLTHALHGTSLSFPPTAAPFVWLSSETHDGTAIAQHLGVRRILVARGDRWGDERHVRITLRDADATDRLIAALRELG